MCKTIHTFPSAVSVDTYSRVDILSLRHEWSFLTSSLKRASFPEIAKMYENKSVTKYVRDGRAPIPEKESTSRVMSANRSKDTGPELLLRKELIRNRITGVSYHPKNLPGRPDIAFQKKKLAIFVNGCFWHSCPYCRPRVPASHLAFWEKKFLRNKERDKEKARELKKLSWRVLVVWECQIKKSLPRTIKRITNSLQAPIGQHEDS